MKDKILKKIGMIPVGLWIFTGTAARTLTSIWQRTVSLVTTPFGIILLIAGGITIAVMVIKERRRQ